MNREKAETLPLSIHVTRTCYTLQLSILNHFPNFNYSLFMYIYFPSSSGNMKGVLAGLSASQGKYFATKQRKTVSEMRFSSLFPLLFFPLFFSPSPSYPSSFCSSYPLPTLSLPFPLPPLITGAKRVVSILA